MNITIRPGLRAPLAGTAAAGLLIGSFLLGGVRAGASAGGNSGAIRIVPDGRITVNGTGTATGTPNQLVLTMGVQVNSFSVASAVAQANRITNRVIAALGARGVPKADVQTANFSIQPNYANNSQVPTGYGVSEQLTVTLTPLTRAGSQIQAAVNAGGNATTVDGVSLDFTDTGPLLASARANAMRDAKARATEYASGLGEHITGVISVSEQPPSVPYPQFFNAVGLVPRASASVPVKPGTQQVSAQVTVVFSVA
jgi:uncharacterized protein YggE